MQRWNGWGHQDIDVPLRPAALAFLTAQLGAGIRPVDAERAAVCAAIPPSRLDNNMLMHLGARTDPALRLRHSCGQSLPDWLRLRHGVPGQVCDAVVEARNEDHLVAILAHAQERGLRVIPVGGATSVVGHLNLPADDRPTLAISMQSHSRLRAIDHTNRLALFDAGVSGPPLEAQLHSHGYTLGHFPQSFEFSTLGGWIATRSSGQQSRRYGRIEQLFAGGRVLQATEALELPPFPASAAGPDLREWVLGSEGRLGIISQAWVNVRSKPTYERFHAIFLPDWQQAVAAARTLAQSDIPFSMLRLSNTAETQTLLRQAGHETSITWLERYLRWRGCGTEKCLLLLGFTGEADQCRRAERDTRDQLQPFGAVAVGTRMGEVWKQNRFRSVYLRNTLWQYGYAVDTVETACTWQQTSNMMHAIEQAARTALASDGEQVHAYTHLSHVYRSGSSVYSTFMYRLTADYEHNLERWQRLKTAVSNAIAEQGGTISHQHGVGHDHEPWLRKEKGSTGCDWLQAVIDRADPHGLFDTGNLLGKSSRGNGS